MTNNELNGKYHKYQAGKGDAPRPVKGDKYRANYDDIFKKKVTTPKPKE